MTSARPDSRYLANTTITTDLSQRLTDLTVSAPGGYEANSARTALAGNGSGRSIEVIADISTGGTGGTLVDHGTGASYRIAVTAGGDVVFSDTSGTLATITPPNVGAGANSYVVAWSTEPNPSTTGAGDALRSEFLVYDIAGAAISWTTATHANSGASSTGTFTVAGVYTGGVMTLTYPAAIDSVRISCRFHTRVETREHFVAQTAAPGNTGIAACEAVVPPAAMLAAGHMAGPGYALAAASMQTTRNRHRLVSPVLQWQHPDPPQFEDDMVTTVGSKWVLDASEFGTGYQIPICWLARIQVPRHVEWLLVRVQWAQWRSNVLVLEDDPVDLLFFAANGPPRPVSQPPNGPLIPAYTVAHYQAIQRTANDTAGGLGVNSTFDFVKVERDAAGMTWVWMAARTEAGSGTGNATYAVRSAMVTPIVLESGYDGFPPNAWGG